MSFNDYLNIQPKVIKMLINSYYKDRLVHAYLFEGEKGTKKKEIAIEFAKLLYCEEENKPCDMCINCLRIEHNNHPNVLLIEPENNSIKKEQIIYLQQEYTKTNLEPGPKVYIIEDIDKMSTNAANSILKFIEEPQPFTYNILITDNLHQILPTIVSRCQVLNFQPISKQEIKGYLMKLGIDEQSASIGAHLTNDILEAQNIVLGEKFQEVVDLVVRLVKVMIDHSENLVILCDQHPLDLYNNKHQLDLFLDILLLFIRDLNKIKDQVDHVVFTNEINFLKENINKINTQKTIKCIDEILKAKIGLENNANTVLLLDNLLINLM